MLVFIAAAFVIDYLPWINLPFLWSETFFHEISHGLAALISGGAIVNIVLNYDGSGVCTTRGGWRFLVSFSGYAGSAFWGYFIFKIASAVSKSNSRYIVASIVLMLSATLLLWARDTSTIIILIILLVMYLAQIVKLPWLSLKWFNVKHFMQIVGVFVMLDAIRSPLYLLDGRDLGDGASLSNLTFLPEIFWVAAWFVIAVGCIYSLWKKTES